MKKLFTTVANANLSAFFPYALALGCAVAVTGAAIQIYTIIAQVI